MFIISNDNFGIENFVCNINYEKQIVEEIEINGNVNLFDKITEQNDSEWNWLVYPPKFYMFNVPYSISDQKISIEIDYQLLDKYDIAIYMMEHFDIEGFLSIYKNIFEFNGICYINDQEYPLKIKKHITL